MLLIFAIAVVSLWAAIIWNIYAIFQPFIDQLWEIQHYNIAYYGAIASLERANLALKKHIPWFEWSWWWLWKQTFWPKTDYNYQNKKDIWWLLSVSNNWIKWEIKNRIKAVSKWANYIITIPQPWKWELDPDLASGFNYNKLEFWLPLQFALYVDSDLNSNHYYTWTNNPDGNKPTINSINISLRVSPKILQAFWWWSALDSTNEDLDSDTIPDDIVVNRSIFWKTGDIIFTINPTISVDYTLNQVNDDDTSIRESVINDYTTKNSNNIVFNNTTQPIVTQYSTPSDYNQIPEWVVWTWQGFQWLFSSPNTKNLHLKFSIFNLLKYNADKIYPYLELKAEFNVANNDSLPDFYYNIYWIWKVGKYKVKIYQKKPIFDKTEASDLVILF